MYKISLLCAMLQIILLLLINKLVRLIIQKFLALRFDCAIYIGILLLQDQIYNQLAMNT